MKISLVYPEHFKMFYGQLTIAFKDCLEKLGHDVVIAHDVNENTELEINFCPLHYDVFIKMVNKKYIMLQMEQFPTKFSSNSWQGHKWNRTKSFIHLYDIIWDTYYEFHKDLYAEYNIPVYDFKLGYHESFDFYSNVIKNKDASFFGSLSDRRRSVLSKLHKFNVVVETGITDENRTKFVNETKVNINIHYSESNLCESLRLIVFLLSNKAFVLTEDFLGDDELKKCVFISNEHDFAAHIDYYINHDEERNKFAEEAYNYLKINRTLYQAIKKCLGV
jgi:hypothetical protein